MRRVVTNRGERGEGRGARGEGRGAGGAEGQRGEGQRGRGAEGERGRGGEGERGRGGEGERGRGGEGERGRGGEQCNIYASTSTIDQIQDGDHGHLGENCKSRSRPLAYVVIACMFIDAL